MLQTAMLLLLAALYLGLGACRTITRPALSPAHVQIATTGSVTIGPAGTPTPRTTGTAPPAPARAPLPPATTARITEGNSGLPEVALVFNVGAGSPPATEVLVTLRDSRTPATFMVMGWLARAEPDLVRSIAGTGFEIGSHGDQVFDLTEVSDAAIAADLQSADGALSPLIGHSTRPLWSPSAGAEDERVRAVAAGLGYDTLLWNVDSGDWRTDASASAVERSVLPRLANGAIVVLHLDSPHSRDATVAALPLILEGLRQRGLTAISLSTLLSHLDSAGRGR